jgi:hypothetical protein
MQSLRNTLYMVKGSVSQIPSDALIMSVNVQWARLRTAARTFWSVNFRIAQPFLGVAGPEDKGDLAGGDRGQELLVVGEVVFKVRVLDHDDLAGRRREAGPDGVALAPRASSRITVTRGGPGRRGRPRASRRSSCSRR